jgi:predicted metal-dependent phosphoesterase TrpH
MSDGKWTPEQVVGWYREHAYDFCALTDHLVCTDTSSLATPTFLTIPGIELHGYDEGLSRTPHVVGLGTGIQGRVEPGISLQAMIDRITGQGMVAIVAHPYWSSLHDAHLASASEYAGIEIYNHTCWEHVGKGDSLTHWDNLLYEGRPVWGIAVDDAHCAHGSHDIGGGWIVVKAPELSEPAILEAIRNGYFYASQGPTIEQWRVTEKSVYVRCSPVERIQVHGPNGSGQVCRAAPGESVSEATFTFRDLPKYVRVTCIDAQQNRAWTNPVFS